MAARKSGRFGRGSPVNIQSALAAYPDIATPIVFAATLEASLAVEREIKEHTPRGAFGALRESIFSAAPERVGNDILGTVSTSMIYAEAVELGSKPHFPPIQPLIDWARAKFGLDEDEAKGAAFGVARTIARKGTEGKRMFERGCTAAAPTVTGIFARALNDIMTEVERRAGRQTEVTS